MTTPIRFLLAAAGLVPALWAQPPSPPPDIAPDRGFQPSHSYALSDIESLDMATGALGFHIPLASLPPGPAGQTASVGLVYSDKYWNVDTSGTTDGRFPRHDFKPSPDAGWRYSFGYRVELPLSAIAPYGQCNGGPYGAMIAVVLPDGGRHWMNLKNCGPPSETWYSIDGTFLRLVIQRSAGDGATWPYSNAWTLYFPDGSRVVDGGGARVNSQSPEQKYYDKNGNAIDFRSVAPIGSDPQTLITDNFGRSITIAYRGIPQADGSTLHQDVITTAAAGGSTTPLTWTITWATVSNSVSTFYCEKTNNPPVMNTCAFPALPRLVSRIDLPNGLNYQFSYGAKYGEMSQAILPTNASAAYIYQLDPSAAVDLWNAILANAPTSKTLAYSRKLDSTVTPVSEIWRYNFTSASSTATAPDGGVSANSFYPVDYTGAPVLFSGSIYKTVRPDGSQVERVFQQNVPGGYLTPQFTPADLNTAVNPWIQAKFESIADSAGNPSRTAIRTFARDKNGNTTSALEYDWAPYSGLNRGANGLPTMAQTALNPALLRATTTAFYSATPDTSVYQGVNTNQYTEGSATRLTFPYSKEISGASGVVGRSEFYYDNNGAGAPVATGNLTGQSSWNSTAGAYSAPLTAGNSVRISLGYDNAGNRTTSTDARGITTAWTYGTVAGCGGGSYSGLYGTAETIAFGTPVEQRLGFGYDLCSGIATLATDANGQDTTTAPDAYGRPMTVNAAGSAVTAYTYDDAQRRVTVRRDLDGAGDGKLASVQEYDPLGRPRLSQQLEDITSDPGLATSGIKVQRVYAYAGLNAYEVVSNPYRGSSSSNSETTMGWTVRRFDPAGRVISVETVDGGAFPNLGGANAASTGTVATSYDATADGRKITVTDQAGRAYATYSDALGRTTKVVEDPGGFNYITLYQYDALGNLLGVCQGGVFSGGVCSGGMGRRFVYDSLSRLKSAQNPENGTTVYSYDANGNLTSKTDGRQVITTLAYDELNRVVTKTYSDGTPAVTYCYDGDTANHASSPARDCTSAPAAALAKGRLTMVSTSVSAMKYVSYDALGRVIGTAQTTDGVSYPFGYRYKPFGGLLNETYPSGRTITYGFDGAGRVNGVSGVLSGQSSNYVSGLNYVAPGGIAQMDLDGGQLHESTGYNSRLQPVSASFHNSTPLLSLRYYYCVGGAALCSGNNGNMLRQTMGSGMLNAQQDYGYDAANRLSSAVESGGANEWSQTYGYDAFGNRWVSANTGYPLNAFTATTISGFDSANRLTMMGAQYDATGNQKQIGGYTYTWDAENRMTASAINGATTSYAYDGDGRRVKKTVNGQATTYVYDAQGQLAAEYGSSGSAPCTTCYVAVDHLGSTRMIVDGRALSPVSFHDYLPFGEEIPAGLGGRDQRYGPADTAQRFTGQLRNVETGLDWFNARYMSSAQGRFTSPDPEGIGSSAHDPQSWNMYAYARNNPLRYTDPFGLNYEVCDADGKNCRNLSDKQYNQYLQSIQSSNLYVTPGGNINYQNDDGSVTKVGSATYYNERAENAGAFLNWAVMQMTLNAIGEGAGRAIGAIGGRIFQAFRAGRTAGEVAEDAIASTPVGRRGAAIDVAPGTNTGTKIGDRWYSGHALDQMQSRGAVPSVVEDTIASGTKSPGNLPNTIKYSTSQADVVTNTRGDVVTVIVKSVK